MFTPKIGEDLLNLTGIFFQAKPPTSQVYVGITGRTPSGSTNLAGWKMNPDLKMYFLLKIVIFHCYVSLPEGIWKKNPRNLQIPESKN